MNRSDHYVIGIDGHLGPEWSDRLADLEITNRPGGDAELSGHLPDQAALFGVLITIRDLGVPLLSLHRTHHHSHGGTSCDSGSGS
jgi:hypothetical protein